MAIKTAKELAAAAEAVARNYKTLYVMGCFGAPMNEKNKARYTKNHKYNKAADRTAMIKAASADTFGFDCGGLIKGLLWGWSGDRSKTYGGASYASNGVPDICADSMIKKCAEVSTDFSSIQVGEAVWCKGHIGVYIGDGLAVECTPKWANCVQITACNCYKAGYNRRNWTKHGKLPYVTYEEEKPAADPADVPNAKAPATVTVKLEVLQKGSEGEQVETLQRILDAMGYDLGSRCPIDGSFGTKTDEAVRAFQKSHGLTVDGIVGAKTWPVLLGV